MSERITLDYDDTYNVIIVSYPISGSGFLLLRNYLRRIGAKQIPGDSLGSWGVNLSFGYEFFQWLLEHDFDIVLEDKAKKIFNLAKKIKESPLSRQDINAIYSSVIIWLKGGVDELEDEIRKKFPNRDSEFYDAVATGIVETTTKHFSRDTAFWEKIKNVFLSPEISGVLFKKGSVSKVAHNPHMAEITAKKVLKGEAAMLYQIKKSKNISKFYEIFAQDNGDGTYDVIRKWGRLSDPGSTQRIDSSINKSLLKEDMLKYIKSKTMSLELKGYINAFGEKHINPKTGQPLPAGQYPLGVSKAPGYGWGKQTATSHTRYLKAFIKDLMLIHAEVKTRGKLTSSQYLHKLEKHIIHFSKEDMTSPVIQHILQGTVKIYKRLESTDKRLKKDFDNKVLINEILGMIDYLEAQLAYY